MGIARPYYWTSKAISLTSKGRVKKIRAPIMLIEEKLHLSENSIGDISSILTFGTAHSSNTSN